MKKFYLFLYPIFILTISFSCTKKSPNDPIVSLLTRNQRITGEWKMSSQDYVRTTTSVSNSITNGNGTINTTIETYRQTYNESDGYLETSLDGNTVSSFIYTETISFDKYGKWSQSVYNMDNLGETLSYSGDWWWLNNSKRKTRIGFGTMWTFWDIDKLSNNELIITYNYDDFDIFNSTDNRRIVVNATTTWKKQ